MQIPSNTSRRDLLKFLAAGGAGALSAGILRARDEPPALRTNSGRIDVHHHFQAPVLPGGPFPTWSPAVSLEQMDQRGTGASLLSHPGGIEVICDGTARGRAAAREVNEYGARVVSDHPDRLGLLAVLPMRDVDGALREIEYALDTLKADGFGISSNNTEKWPGDPSLLPIFQELHRRQAVVFIHPLINKCRQTRAGGVGETCIAYDCDTIRAITSLLYNGVLSRCPDIRFIVNHSGSAVPALAGLIQDRVPGAQSGGFGYELRKLYYECARVDGLAPTPALMKFVPPSQLLFGTDSPAGPMAPAADPMPDDVSDAILSAMERENAERIFPRLQA